jgi:DNA-binding transcriptional LysR family regulator
MVILHDFIVLGDREAVLDLRHARHLLAVVSHPTVQAAADAIHLTQPAPTKSIARFEEKLAAALRPGHPLSRKRKPVLADLAAHPIAGASTAPRYERWSVERAGREGAQPPVPALVCDNYEVLVRLAERSDTIVFGPRNVLAAYERAGRLKVMSWPLEGPESGPSPIRSRGRHLSPAAERLMLLFEN